MTTETNSGTPSGSPQSKSKQTPRSCLEELGTSNGREPGDSKKDVSNTGKDTADVKGGAPIILSSRHDSNSTNENEDSTADRSLHCTQNHSKGENSTESDQLTEIADMMETLSKDVEVIRKTVTNGKAYLGHTE